MNLTMDAFKGILKAVCRRDFELAGVIVGALFKAARFGTDENNLRLCDLLDNQDFQEFKRETKKNADSVGEEKS